MSSTPRLYLSTDASAPALTGESGSLQALLDAILNTGYGATPGSGWTRVTGSNSTVAAWRNSTADNGTGFYLQCSDNAGGTGGAKEAQMRGFESMTNATTGTLPFPTTAQVAGALIWKKSSAASSTARAWCAIACRRWIYLFIDTDGNGIDQAAPYFAGDLVALQASDPSRFALFGSVTQNQGTANTRSNLFVSSAFTASVSDTGAYMPRNGAQVASPITVHCVQARNAAAPYGAASNPLAYPYLGTLAVDVALVNEGALAPRARLPSVYVPLHNRPLAVRTPLTGPVAGALAGKAIVAINFRGTTPQASANDGQVIFDMEGPD